MVSSIIPGAANPAAQGSLGVEPRVNARPGGLAQRPDEAGAPRLDEVAVGDTAAWAAARESVRAGLEQVHAALDVGRAGQTLLARIDELAEAYEEDPEAAEADLAAALANFAERVETAIGEGARLLAGEDVSVQAEAGAAPIAVGGLNLRLTDGAGGVFAFDIEARFGGEPAALAEAVTQSRAALQAGLQRLADSARALQAHQGFLGVLAGAANGVRDDLDADAARLVALQVRQDLDALSGAAIANVEPKSVLSLFRV
jgi:broad specificity phosphatase PhoE